MSGATIKYPAILMPERFTGPAAVARIQGASQMERGRWICAQRIFEEITRDFPNHGTDALRTEFLAALRTLQRENYLEIKEKDDLFYSIQIKIKKN